MGGTPPPLSVPVNPDGFTEYEIKQYLNTLTGVEILQRAWAT